MAEKDIRTSIKKYLDSIPFSEWVISPPNTQTGEPDIRGTARCLNGRLLLIEVKRPKKEGGKALRKAQDYKMDRWARAGALVMRQATTVNDVRRFIELVTNLEFLQKRRTR